MRGLILFAGLCLSAGVSFAQAPTFPAATVAGVIYDARMSGSCIWDSTHDVAPCIQAAIDKVAALPSGGEVQVPAGAFNVGTPLTVTKSGVSLRGVGLGGILRHDAPPNVMEYATRLVWTGAAGATMLTVSPPNNPATGQRIGGTNVSGIMFDCASLAATCVRFASSTFSHVDVGFAEPNGGAGLMIDTTSLAETNNPDLNTISAQGIVINSATPGVVLDGSGAGNGNTSILRLPLIRVIHKDGDCMQIRRADHAMVYMLACGRRPSGVGNTLVLYGNNTYGGAYSNWFGYVGGAGPIVAKGTATYTSPATNNVIDFLDKANNTPDPTIEAGATMQWRRDDGVLIGFGSYQADFAPTASTMTLLRARTEADPVRVLSNAQTGIALMATNGPTPLIGRFYIDAATGLMHFSNVGNLTGIEFGATMPVNILGALKLTGLATSCSGKPTGTIVNLSGVLNVCP